MSELGLLIMNAQKSKLSSSNVFKKNTHVNSDVVDISIASGKTAGFIMTHCPFRFKLPIYTYINLRGTYIDFYSLVHAQKKRVKVDIVDW